MSGVRKMVAEDLRVGPGSMVLFLNRNVMVFDLDGNQDVPAQKAVSCYRINKKKAQEAIDRSTSFFISSFRDWTHPISKRSMEYLLGLRSRKRDIAEAEGGA